MKYTRDELLEKIEKNDVEFFYNNLYCEVDTIDNKFECVYDQNYGDGNDWFLVYYFPEERLTVKLDLTYSSWSDPGYYKVAIALPYEYKETRYRSVSLKEFRKAKLEEILDETGEQE